MTAIADPQGFVLDPALGESLKARSNVMGARALAKDYGLIVGAFAIAIAVPNPLGWLVAMLLLSGAHVGLAILTHEAAHRSLFAHGRLNDWVGHYLCALPNFNSMPLYRSYHMTHHRLAGTPEDPDWVMVKDYPISAKRLRRKLLRDLSGVSGLRFLVGIIGMLAGVWKFQLNGRVEKVDYCKPVGFLHYLGIFVRNGGGFGLLWNLTLWAVLAALGHGWLYLLWGAAYVFPFALCMRVRVLADHANVAEPMSTDPLLHARTTHAAWWEKLLFAPHNEHYHLEHHLMPSCPHWNLPKLHQHLAQAGVIPLQNQATSLTDVLRRVTTAQ